MGRTLAVAGEKRAIVRHGRLPECEGLARMLLILRQRVVRSVSSQCARCGGFIAARSSQCDEAGGGRWCAIDAEASSFRV